jgi:outer membrane receptor protein involved in Fe transport
VEGDAEQSAVPAAASAPTGASKEGVMDVVVVTGVAGAGGRSKVKTSYSITTISEEAMRMQAPTSVTDAMKSVPGLWVESSGGDASGNIRARGIPANGFQAVNMLEDGIPVQHDPYPNSMTVDQVFRLDETIDGIEVVRGGPSSIFYSSAPAAAINFIPRAVGDSASGLVKYSIGENHQNRVDFWYGRPLADGWKAYVGGFYRRGHGQRDPGYETQRGGQIRIGATRELARGHMSFDFKHLDDTVPYYTGLPMQRANGKITAVPGIDPGRGNYQGNEVRDIQLRRYDGSIYHFDAADGTNAKRNQLTFKINHELGGGWTFNNALRVSNHVSNRDDVQPQQVYSIASFLNGIKSGTAKFGVNNPQLVLARNGAAFTPSNGLVMTSVAGTDTATFHEVSNDLQLHRSFQFGAQRHDVTIGYGFAHYTQGTYQIRGQFLMGATDNAPLVAMVGLNTKGQMTTLTDPTGVFKQGTSYTNDQATVDSHAVYVADDWQITKELRLDAGVRWDRNVTKGVSERYKNYNLGTYAAQAVMGPTGDFVHFDSAFSKVGWTLGANYQIDSKSGVFVRYTPTFRLPGLNKYIPNYYTRAKQFVETMKLAEFGYKSVSKYVQLFPTVFHTKYDNVTSNTTIFDPFTNAPVTQQVFANSVAYGIELDGKITPHPMFDLGFTGTLQHSVYKNYQFATVTPGSTSALTKTDYSGNQLVRIPKMAFRLVPGLKLMDDRLRLQMSYERNGLRFADAANTQALPAYTTINLSGSYAITPSLTVYGYVDNANDAEGLTEGNPRASEVASVDAAANVFIARPIFGRTFRAAVKYDF